MSQASDSHSDGSSGYLRPDRSPLRAMISSVFAAECPDALAHPFESGESAGGASGGMRIKIVIRGEPVRLLTISTRRHCAASR